MNKILAFYNKYNRYTTDKQQKNERMPAAFQCDQIKGKMQKFMQADGTNAIPVIRVR